MRFYWRAVDNHTIEARQVGREEPGPVVFTGRCPRRRSCDVVICCNALEAWLEKQREDRHDQRLAAVRRADIVRGLGILKQAMEEAER